jgi:hypothetical protein
MGNQPSSPATPVVAASSQPVVSACDLNCQREKDLAGLKTALNAAEKNKTVDPEGYEQARIKYFTLLEGQGWLAKEKERVAKSDVDPVITELTSKYETLKGSQKSQSMFANLAQALKSQKNADAADNAFLKRQLHSGTEDASVLNRLAQLGGVQPGFSFAPYISIALDVAIGILGLAVLYLVYSRWIAPALTPAVVEMSAGRRR